MNRRELLQRSALLLGGTLLGADSILAKNIDWDQLDHLPDDSKGFGLFSKAQIKLLNEVAETIIPTTDIPGAKAAKVGQFIAVIVSDCYEAADQKRFMDGLAQLDAECIKRYGKKFMKSTAKLRTDFLTELDAEQKAFQKSKKKEIPSHYFRVIKDLVLWGYFTSEIGMTQAQRYVEYPGKYTTIDYKRGDRNFSAER
jgi:Gluconate 2-dehydrogenase subunit 3